MGFSEINPAVRRPSVFLAQLYQRQWCYQNLHIVLKIQRVLRAVEIHVLHECFVTNYVLMCHPP